MVQFTCSSWGMRTFDSYTQGPGHIFRHVLIYICRNREKGEERLFSGDMILWEVQTCPGFFQALQIQTGLDPATSSSHKVKSPNGLWISPSSIFPNSSLSDTWGVPRLVSRCGWASRERKIKYPAHLRWKGDSFTVVYQSWSLNIGCTALHH